MGCTLTKHYQSWKLRLEGVASCSVERVKELATKKGVSMAQISQAWIMAKGGFPVCGLETKERIDQAVVWVL